MARQARSGFAFADSTSLPNVCSGLAWRHRKSGDVARRLISKEIVNGRRLAVGARHGSKACTSAGTDRDEIPIVATVTGIPKGISLDACSESVRGDSPLEFTQCG